MYFRNLWNALLGRPGYAEGVEVGLLRGVEIGYSVAVQQHTAVHRAVAQNN